MCAATPVACRKRLGEDSVDKTQTFGSCRVATLAARDARASAPSSRRLKSIHNLESAHEITPLSFSTSVHLGPKNRKGAWRNRCSHTPSPFESDGDRPARLHVVASRRDEHYRIPPIARRLCHAVSASSRSPWGFSGETGTRVTTNRTQCPLEGSTTKVSPCSIQQRVERRIVLSHRCRMLSV